VTRIPLRDIAFARSGEKGDVVYLCLVAHDERDFGLLDSQVTAEVVEQIFAPILTGRVERFELPKIGALNFALHGALGGGRSRNLAFDESGKTLSSRLLALEVSVDDTSMSESRPWASG
jgi:hypothetical protein